MTTVELECEICYKKFNRKISEYNRNKKKDRRIYCSLKCGGKANYQHISEWAGKYNDNLRKGSIKDEWSDFRLHLRRVRRRNKEWNVTLEDLKHLWIAQQGVCQYTGVELTHPHNHGINDPLYTASLDRIDSTRGYVKGNIQFISIAANFAKGQMTHEDMIRFCELIKLTG